MTRAAAPFAALLFLCACASPDTAQPNTKVSDMFATPEWAKGNQARSTTTRAITQNDLINADGSCPMAVAATDGAAPADADAALSGQGALPAVQGGVALGMTECEVLQRTGTPDTFNISAEGTDRVATLTVTRGSWPGLYSFRGGRLTSVERIAAPAPAKPTRAAAKKQAPKSQLRGAQQ
ncbi:hypothetical protein [Pseudorhodoplanes sp.]|uniref:hypothetical protein n=1 Tax=Pseudorhodoplanes sp. TaxID=1934341 RepID=UPI002C646351|nr:hypothetical protein [Pseudorhodoplanes sp.]HWV52410.1 hypothetical protein [Pseudorhodoplanes sp.]